jgi:hypothetical protein
MGRPIILYRRADLDCLPVQGQHGEYTLRIDKPDYRVWLSHTGVVIKVDERDHDTGGWKLAEQYEAR